MAWTHVCGSVVEAQELAARNMRGKYRQSQVILRAKTVPGYVVHATNAATEGQARAFHGSRLVKYLPLSATND